MTEGFPGSRNTVISNQEMIQAERTVVGYVRKRNQNLGKKEMGAWTRHLNTKKRRR